MSYTIRVGLIAAFVLVFLGDWEGESCATAVVHEFIAMMRTERKKDRVELSETDLVEVQKKYAYRNLKIIGWFHSRKLGYLYMNIYIPWK